MELQLYADPCTVNCRKVLAGANLLEVELTLVRQSFFGGDQQSEAFLALNPNGMLPALRHGEFVLWESDVILQYLACLGEPSSSYPTEVQSRADVHRWQAWSSAQWFSACYPFLIENGVKGHSGEPADQALLDAAAPVFHRFAAVLNEHLGGRRWMVGDAPTLADISVAAPMHLHPAQRLPLESYPAILAWYERVASLDCWKATDPWPHFPSASGDKA